MIEPRDYQTKAVEAVFGEYDKGIDSTLLVMPTGTGKTTAAAMVAGLAKERGQRSLFLVHREILVNQAAKTLREYGLSVAVEMASEDAQRSAKRSGARTDVVVGTVQSLKGHRLASWDRDYFGQIITDECHRGAAPSYSGVYDHFQGYRHLGITATPDGSSRGLGRVFQSRCFEYRLSEAIKSGWLVPIEHRKCAIQIDLGGVRKTAGDLNIGDLAERVSPYVEQLARATAEEVGERPTVVFTPDVFSAKAVAETLVAVGLPSRYVAGSAGMFGMPKEERKAILKEFRDRKFQVIVCCDLLVEGWDCPFVEAVAVMRPTIQRYRFVQMAGRGTRPSPGTGKKNLLIVDFDWTADTSTRDLCKSAISLFSCDDETEAMPQMRAARRVIEEFGEVEPHKAVEDAEAAWYVCNKFMITLTGQKAVYEKIAFDPVGVGNLIGVKLGKYDKDPWKSGHATEAQLRYLRDLGVELPGKLSRWGASKLLKHLVKRKDQGLSTPAQIQKLMAIGCRQIGLAQSLRAEAADKALAEIESVRPVAQGILF